MKKLLLVLSLICSSISVMAQPFNHDRDNNDNNKRYFEPHNRHDNRYDKRYDERHRWRGPVTARYSVQVSKVDWDSYVVDRGMYASRGRKVVLDTGSCGITRGNATVIISSRGNYLENRQDRCSIRRIEEIDGRYFHR